MRYFAYILLTLVLLWSCNTTKNITEGNYLLDGYSIKSDNKKVDILLLEDFVRQKPNSGFLIFGKMRLGIYNMAGDTSKWINRSIRKMGQAPVIFNDKLSDLSAKQIQKDLFNQGFLNARVDTVVKIKKKKASLTYNITSGQPYTVRNYEQRLSDNKIARPLSMRQRFSTVRPGIIFNQEVLEEERERMSSQIRNMGYYTFTKDNIYYQADTTLNSNQVDLFLSLRHVPDSTGFKRYKFRNVTIVSGYDQTNDENKENFLNPDTTLSKGVTIIHGKNNFLRNSMLLRNSYIIPGRQYSDMAVERTYTAFNGISAVRQTSVDLRPVIVDTAHYVDARITIAPANIHWFQTGIDGTNSEGDIGVAPHVSYQHQNLFNGAEILSVKLKGAYEFITGEKSSDLMNKNYYEYGIETGISFPQFLFPWMKRSWREIPTASTQITLGHINQHRSEYTRQFLSASYTFRWSTYRSRLTHALDLLDVNYVRMPWASASFKDELNKKPVLKTTYDNQLVARTGYNITYTRSSRGARFPKNSYTIRGGLDLAGWLPHLAKLAGATSRNNEGKDEIVGIAYAEYVKIDLSFAQTRNFDRQKSFAYRIALGVANPFSNSDILPYERRYFSGGANSLRGWSTRRLGPGSYQPGDSTTFINQAGDIKLDIGIEYRHKISEMFEFAAFADAGNIWTIRNYQGQEGGVFEFDKFYKEIALSYGLGIRFDLSFLLLRLDAGMKAYDPSRSEGDRLVMFKPRFSRDMAWHFAIGYPF